MTKKDKHLYPGIHACMEALREGKEMERIFVKKGTKGEALTELLQKAKSKDIPVSLVPPEKLDRMTRVNHQGVIGLGALIEYSSLEAEIPYLYEKGKDPLILILDRITDVRNFGAICRTAECMGVDVVVIPDKGAAQVNMEAMKTSAGALNRLSICRVPDLKKAMQFLQQSGLQVIAASEKGSHLLHEAALVGPLAVIMGSEEDGVSEPLIRYADALLKISMPGRTESLNVSVAAGMFLYEVAKQRIQ
ncbi:MAG: 23S rRNA (guanosine(2251)-2'-O)-methyltransferase RlmB [Bacteroidetes bacterium]|jgi:23S rRNA (guanosine2251-2'-O)-methyltransferase|nr:23S rRNA (guanosine(2251)-2'-O)-methyltransferase RlmB [Bacteroidota bacterium]